jgi:hypothetical protein
VSDTQTRLDVIRAALWHPSHGPATKALNEVAAELERVTAAAKNISHTSAHYGPHTFTGNNESCPLCNVLAGGDS